MYDKAMLLLQVIEKATAHNLKWLADAARKELNELEPKPELALPIMEIPEVVTEPKEEVPEEEVPEEVEEAGGEPELPLKGRRL